MNYLTPDEWRALPEHQQDHWYNPETGWLHEIERTQIAPNKWAYVIAPYPAHCMNHGYPIIRMKSCQIPLSRAVWIWHQGFGVPWPRRITNINGNKLDTRIENLRAARSGHQYRAQIWAGGKNHYLGMFATKEEARAAEDQLRAVLGLEKREVSPKQQQAAEIDLWSDSAESIIERNSRYFD